MIGLSQFGNYTNKGENHFYCDLLNFPGSFGQDLIITDPTFESKKIATGSIGFDNSRSFKFLMNNRLNYGIDFFQYKLLDKNILQNFKGSNTTPWGAGGLHYSYYRVNGGLGTGLLITEHSTSTLNLDFSAYFNQKGKATENMTFTTLGLNINLKSNFSIPLLNSFFSDYQFKLGYYIIPPRLSSYMLNEGYSNGATQLQQSYIEMPRLYVSLKKNFYSNNSSKSKKVKIKSPKTKNPPIIKKPITSKKNGCVSGKCKNGKGEYISYIGTYKGRFKDGEHHGQGVMRLSDGSSYDGKWRMGNRHGKGTYISKNKEELSGDWIDDEFADPKLKPELVIRNIVFKDSDGDDEIYAEESGNINFNLENTGKGTAYNIVFTIKDLNNIKGLEFQKRIRIEKLKSGAKEKISIPVTSDLDLKTGLVNIKISAEELNGFPPDDVSINFKSLAYINPDLKIIDYHFSSLEEGKNKLMVNDRVLLSFIIQNRGQGRAQDIVVSLDFTSDENIFNVDEQLFAIRSLAPNESKTIAFEFFTNTKFKKKYIDISVDVKEKFNKYGESKVLSQEIGKDIRSNQTVNYDGGNTREEVVIDNLSLTSSVDKSIPTNRKVENRFALVIGNEDYTSFQRTLSSEQNVDYAVNDATIFKKYCLSTLGVKEENMFFLKDATAIEMNRKIELVSKIIKKLGNKAELIVYYAGHGYPDETTKVPYLIPVDVPASDLSYAIKLDDFYKDLGATGAKNITVFLDACFTGEGRESGLVASRGVKVKPKEGEPTGNTVVFSASSGNQSALPYHKEGHGMFTYYLLKKLQESKGKVTMGELADYINDKVSIQSLKTNEKEQDPEVNASPKVINDWRNWKF